MKCKMRINVAFTVLGIVNNLLLLVQSGNANCDTNDVAKYIYMQYYTGPTTNDYNRIPYNESLTLGNYVNFDKNKETTFYFPGWSEQPSQNETSVNTLATAFLARKTSNFIVFDYGQLIRGDSIMKYMDAFTNVSKIGSTIGCYFTQYVRLVQPINLVHLVSHSMGSQIMSHVANVYGPGKFPWLTALDPAGPLFNFPFVKHLTKEDGKFVDVIHTDAGLYGDGREVGHVDFFPNRGIRIQPYCWKYLEEEFCSHRMSWMYYAMSVLNSTLFVAQQCSRNLFCGFGMINCCPSNAPLTHMGYDVDKGIQGTFFLKTDNIEPFGLGAKGLYI